MILKINGNSNFNLRHTHVDNFSTRKMHVSFFFYYSLLVLVYIYFIFFSGQPHMYFLSRRLDSVFNKLNLYGDFFFKIKFIKRRKILFFKTLQRAPMAHRQWSQEQYEFRYYTYTLEIVQKTKINRIPLNSKLFENKNLPLFIRSTPKFLFNTSLISFNSLIFTRHYNYLVWENLK